VRLLSGGARITPDDEPEREIRPSDIAVLCRTNKQVGMVQEELRALGVPAVVGRTGSVLDSDAALEWLNLLTALERPSSPQRVRRAAVGVFGGWEPDQLLDASDDDLMPLYEMYSSWARTLQTRGVPALLAAIERTTGLTERVLSKAGGERDLTDIHHLAELLHAAQRSGGIRSPADWLATERAEARGRPEESETRARRLETDAEAVQLLTIHGAKGLEFPIVLAPFLWDLVKPRLNVPVFHPTAGDPRQVDVGGKGNWDDFDTHAAIAKAEQEGEETRLMYVAITRARHHLALWWAPCGHYKEAPISRVLFGREPDRPNVIADRVTVHRADTALARLEPVIESADGTIAAEAVDAREIPPRWIPPEKEAAELQAARFDRPIDHAWRRTSFSGLTAAAHDAPPPPDPEDSGKDDEPAETPDAAGPGSSLPMEVLPAGLQFGSLVHEILEHVDLAAPDRAERLDEVARQAVANSGMEADPGVLAAALDAVARTPLFTSPGAAALEDVPAPDQVAEMGFEFPVAAEAGTVGLEDLADVLAIHLPEGDPLAGYPDRLRRLGAARFRGYLTGFIDLTMRIDGRYWVTDYKTNRLPARGETADPLDYTPGRLAAAMVESDYALQALLYQVALHRYLRHRLPEYDPARHLGGAMWLFVRGMIGPATPEADGGRCGVFAWKPPPGLIPAIDALFAGGAG
jgi:exodeoxyribonuclease V beta subunit